MTSDLANRPPGTKHFSGCKEGLAMATTPIRKFSVQEVSHAVITAAMRVHCELGPGLLESTYVACLQYELVNAGFDLRNRLVFPSSIVK